MSAAEAFFDTNVLLYLLSEETAKAARAEELIARGGITNVQVLNEFASISIRKLAMPIEEIREILTTIRQFAASARSNRSTAVITISVSISSSDGGSRSTTPLSWRRRFAPDARCSIRRTCTTAKRSMA
jgi:predicted nucleic acid-binding protein